MTDTVQALEQAERELAAWRKVGAQIRDEWKLADRGRATISLVSLWQAIALLRDGSSPNPNEPATLDLPEFLQRPET